MRNFILFSCLLLISIALSAQTYTSNSNGNWLSPLTWTPMGIPWPGTTVIINHQVSLDTSWGYTSGSITVNSGGSLKQDQPVRDLLISGTGTFTNSGTTDIRYILLNGGSLSNSGTFEVSSFLNNATLTNTGSIIKVDSFLNTGTIDNFGTIRVSTFYNDNVLNNHGDLLGLVTKIDSLTNAHILNNHVGGLVDVDSSLNLGTLSNEGTYSSLQFLNDGNFINDNFVNFDDLSNFGTFINNDSMIGTQSMWNAEYFFNNGYIYLGKSFLNGDTMFSTARFDAEGTMEIADSWYNFDTVQGATGYIEVGDTSYNSGVMLGTFDLCDLTPPASSPYVDYNFGSIDTGIVYCDPTSVDEIHEDASILYPNPNQGSFQLSNLSPNVTITVTDVFGKEIGFTLQRMGRSAEVKLMVPAGIYFLRARSFSRRFIVE